MSCCSIAQNKQTIQNIDSGRQSELASLLSIVRVDDPLFLEALGAIKASGNSTIQCSRFVVIISGRCRINHYCSVDFRFHTSSSSATNSVTILDFNGRTGRVIRIHNTTGPFQERRMICSHG